MIQSIKYSKKTQSNFIFNLLTFLIIASILIFIAWGLKQMAAPITVLEQQPVTLEYSNLFQYSLRTLLRMLIAVIVSLIFTFIYASLAVKSKKCEQILIPLLDILQSLPILGYISFTVTVFLALFPSSIMGAECAAIFAIFTSQVWNMTFSFYYSLKNIPQELHDAAYIFRMSKWRQFWQVSVPYAVPRLVWNIVVSISSGWFFVVASEVITVGNTHITLPRIGSYIALAITQKDLYAISSAIMSMSLVIISYDQLLLRPLVAWSDRFRYEMNAGNNVPHSWAFNLFQRSLIIHKLFSPIAYIAKFILYLPILNRYSEINSSSSNNFSNNTSWSDYLWYTVLGGIACFSVYYIYHFLHYDIGWSELLNVFVLASITMLRVVVLIILAAIIWVPIGIYVGLNPKVTAIVQPLAQFFAAFPANLLFPIVFIIITRYDLNPNIWLSPLMIMGAQWYILFNVIVGASTIPNDLKDATRIFKVSGWNWWFKVMLPAITPYFITGAITASGGAWNASIVAEIINFGDRKIAASGIGSYIAEMTIKADFNKIVLGMGVMALFVVLFNRLFWQPLNEYSIKRFQL
ncbi:ABC transporter permease [Candidatus Tisiphia endosymbiont of Myopa tessellatipennis]|uniref:ABC transporter permease n=1 Tax=Candidatus Tisiphia endosymbiont of Myopa tessellatipennis TaxID=3066257 RepID=UPI00313F29A7